MPKYPPSTSAKVAMAPTLSREVIVHRSVLPLFSGSTLDYVIHRHQTNEMTSIRIVYVGTESTDVIPFALSAARFSEDDYRMEVLTNVSKLISELEAFKQTVEKYNEE